MAGVAALVRMDGGPVEHAALQRLIDRATYRGPDGIATRVHGPVAMARLALHSTPEASFERQPLLSRDHTLWVVADARVDNRDELISRLAPQLAQEGKHAADPAMVITDADLLLAAYQRWGLEAPAHVVGDFAWVLWDSRNKRLMAARDVFGVKPLHYARVGALLCFASEAQQLVAHPSISNAVDRQSLLATLQRGCPPPDRSCYRDIHAMAPAHVWWIDQDGAEQRRRYWHPSGAAPIRYRQLDDYSQHWLEVMGGSVRARLRRREALIGVELSSGLDSSLITALAAHQDEGGQALRALTHSNPAFPRCDESAAASRLADRLGVSLQVVNDQALGGVTSPSYFDPGPESPRHRLQPAGAAAAQHWYDSGARVVLSGNGGDDFTCGSRLGVAVSLRGGEIGPLIDSLRPAGRSWPTLARTLLADVAIPVSESALASLLTGLKLRSETQSNRLTEQWSLPGNDNLSLRHQSLQPLLDAMVQPHVPLLLEGRYATMTRRGIEVRHPFLDRRVAEFAAAVCPSLWRRGAYSKWLTRQATQHLLPDFVRLNRRKITYEDRIVAALRHHSPRLLQIIQNRLLERWQLGSSDNAMAALNHLIGHGVLVDRRLVQTALVASWLANYETGWEST